MFIFDRWLSVSGGMRGASVATMSSHTAWFKDAGQVFLPCWLHIVWEGEHCFYTHSQHFCSLLHWEFISASRFLNISLFFQYDCFTSKLLISLPLFLSPRSLPPHRDTHTHTGGSGYGYRALKQHNPPSNCSSSIIHGAWSWQVTALSWGWAANTSALQYAAGGGDTDRKIQ